MPLQPQNEKVYLVSWSLAKGKLSLHNLCTTNSNPYRSYIWEVKTDIIQCIHLCFCMLAISFYFVNCVIISCKLSFNSRFTRNQIPIMSFLGFKKAELGCKMSELHLYVVKRQNWVVIIRKWICFSILTPEGASISLGINNFSHASRTRCKRC